MGITAADLMTRNVVTLSPDMTLSEMDSILIEREISGAPVVASRRLVGVASQADIVRSLWEGQNEASRTPAFYASPFPVPISALEYLAKDSRRINDLLTERTVQDVMTTEPLIAHPEDSVEEVSHRMFRDRIHRLPVTESKSETLVGIITTLDLARAISKYGLASAP